MCLSLIQGTTHFHADQISSFTGGTYWFAHRPSHALTQTLTDTFNLIRCLEEHGGRGPQGCNRQIWQEPMGANIIPPRSQNTKAMQSALVRMARSFYQEDRMVKGLYSHISRYPPIYAVVSVAGRRRETAASCEAHAYPVANYCPHSWTDGHSVLGALSKVTRRG